MDDDRMLILRFCHRTDPSDTNMTTRVIPEHPGFSWLWDGSVWKLQWTVLPSVYSPPCLFPMVRRLSYRVPDGTSMGLVIGKDGRHFKNITHLSGALYIYCRDAEIEIWGFDNTPEIAMWMVHGHIQSLHVRARVTTPFPSKRIVEGSGQAVRL